jgi:short-subunit dehydrogenase
MKSFSNKVAAITGAGSGIGRALALELAAQNCALSLSDVNETGLAETAKLLADSGVKVTTAKVDVSKLEQVQAWAKKTVKDHGKVNLVFNNAGVAVAGTVEGLSYEEYEWITNINFWGVVYGTKEFLPHLKASGEGHVINISSVFGLFAQPTQSAYNATKFAVRGFTESLRQELDMTGSTVSATCVHPGGIKTNIARSARTNESMRAITGGDPAKATADFEKMFSTTAKKAAQVILDGVKRDARRVLIGNDARAFDVMQRLLPTAYQSLVTRAMKAQSKRK